MDSLDQILQDVEEDLFIDSENDVRGKIPHDKNIKVNIDLVDQVCEKLIADNCMPTEVHEACRSVDNDGNDISTTGDPGHIGLPTDLPDKDSTVPLELTTDHVTTSGNNDDDSNDISTTGDPGHISLPTDLPDNNSGPSERISTDHVTASSISTDHVTTSANNESLLTEMDGKLVLFFFTYLRHSTCC
ncbi:hypothetical protein C0Q70_08455 [Pomacea canaliculata]|uniref:Uncharacterized protein n=1 Tax=Pomacea canaliculata TaxID=400727 RepID=A0A2T7PHX3_POMCA|nr:hypothetical protein C0Q70_08455 [Pomacea canaliculata]